MRPPKQKQPLANRRLSSGGSRLKTPKNGISTGIACCSCQTRGPVKEEKICMDKEHHHTHSVMLKHSYLACFKKQKITPKRSREKHIHAI